MRFRESANPKLLNSAGLLKMCFVQIALLPENDKNEKK